MKCPAHRFLKEKFSLGKFRKSPIKLMLKNQMTNMRLSSCFKGRLVMLPPFGYLKSCVAPSVGPAARNADSEETCDPTYRATPRRNELELSAQQAQDHSGS